MPYREYTDLELDIIKFINDFSVYDLYTNSIALDDAKSILIALYRKLHLYVQSNFFDIDGVRLFLESIPDFRVKSVGVQNLVLNQL